MRMQLAFMENVQEWMRHEKISQKVFYFSFKKILSSEKNI